MMADHWKLIANRLGAPGVDEPESEEQAAEPAAKPQSTAKAERSAKADSSAAGRFASQPPAKSSPSGPSAEHRRGAAAADSAAKQTSFTEPTAATTTPAGKAGSVSDPVSKFGFDPNLPIPDEALSFKPPRNRAGRSESQSNNQSPPPTPPPAARSFSEPPTDVAPEARREAQRMPDKVEPSEVPAEAAPPAKTAKRKSSWESLANMFNIKVDRSKPAEEVKQAPEVPAADFSADRSKASGSRDRTGGRGTSRNAEDQQLSIFSGEQSDEPNAALKSMFGESSAAPAESWGKPRMVDDLGWDNDAESDTSDKPASQASGTEFESSYEDDAGADDAGEEPVRRGRRRRRGRRGRGDVADSPISKSPISKSPAADKSTSRGGKLDHWGELSEVDELASHDDEWPEPDSFETSASSPGGLSSGVDREPDFEADSDEEASGGEPERRSSRRRRRGRGRGRDREAAESTEPAAGKRSSQRSRGTPVDGLDDDSEEVGFVSEVGPEDEFDADVVVREPRRDDASDDERGGSRGRRRRRSRNDEGRPERAPTRGRASRDLQSEAVGKPKEDVDLDSDMEQITGFESEEDEVSEDGKHRSIPTWADSIQSLVTANMENRKRGDNRGAPRGRPRGRR